MILLLYQPKGSNTSSTPRVHWSLHAPCCSCLPGFWIGCPDPLDLHGPACLILLSPASFSVSHCVTVLPSLPPQFPMHLTGQGIAAHLTQGGLAQVFFCSPSSLRWQYPLVTDIANHLMLDQNEPEKDSAPCFSSPFSTLSDLLHNKDDCNGFTSVLKQ